MNAALMEVTVGFAAIPAELIVEMIRLVPRAYGHICQLNKRCKGIVVPHVEWAKTASCRPVNKSDSVYWCLPNGCMVCSLVITIQVIRNVIIFMSMENATVGA
nr:Hypothetical protein FSTVLC9_454 [Faustovirus]